MRRRLAVIPLLLAAAALPLRADTVRLKNGRAYEGVIAERTAQGVRVQLAFGHLVIPAEQVADIEKAPSALAAYLARKVALQARPTTTAAAWLELAFWAKTNDLPSSARESALLAAELDPRLPGLDAMLRPHGLVFEEKLGRWIPFEESMARRGLVRYDGEWISVAEQRERIAEHERRRAAAAQEAASRRMADAAESILRTQQRIVDRDERMQLAQMREAELYARSWGQVVTFPGFWVPPVVVVVNPPRPAHPGRPPHPGQPPQAPSQRNSSFGAVQSRQPGSLLPPFGQPIVSPELHHLPAPGTASSNTGRR
jgi:hypothetical protein